MMINTQLFFFFLLLVSSLAKAQAPPKPFGALPSEAQLRWHEMEMYTLIHFGVDTYTDKEWGYGDEDPALVNPVAFDAEQIVADSKAGGFKGVILVAKHHDGLCLWPTKTTTHNITQSPWKNGKGDMVRDFQLACQKLGMKFGVYCSPWDRNHPQYGTPEYVNVYREQLKELYSNYGPLFISWHDGANGGDGYYGGARETRKIDRTTYYGWDTIFAMVRKMQPSAVIFGDIGPDVRWVGNEEGFAGETSWATYTPQPLDGEDKPANGAVKYWLATEGTKNGAYWMPAECDVPLRPGWFYHASQDDQVKSPYTLLDLYYKSVGRGANLDLGLAPDQRGVLHANDRQSLAEFGKLLKATFRQNLAKGARLTASNVRGNNQAKFGTAFLLDDDRYSYWATDDKVLHPELIMHLPAPKTFNVIRLRENIKLGQRITSVAIDVQEKGRWQEIAKATSIGANRLIRLQQHVTAGRLRLRITGADASIALSDFGLFKEPPYLTAPMLRRSKEGLVEITSLAPVAAIHYTVDGAEPTSRSPRYAKPFLLEQGGVVKARSFEGASQSSAVTSKLFGLSKKGWTAMDEGATTAIDENEHSVFVTPAGAPKEIRVDLGQTQLLKGFSYLPRQDKRADGIADRFVFSVSQDGVNWKEVASDEFSNIRANPVEQVVRFEKPLEGRYFQFSAERLIQGDRLTIAELGVLVK